MTDTASNPVAAEPEYRISWNVERNYSEGYQDGFADGYSRGWKECWEHMRTLAQAEAEKPEESK